MKKGKRMARRLSALLVVALTMAMWALPLTDAANASVAIQQTLGQHERAVWSLDFSRLWAKRGLSAAGKLLIPGGQAVGVAIHTQGVVVVGVSDGAGLAAGLRAGDVLLSINGRPLDSADILTETVNAAAGQPLSILLDRSGREQTVLVTPQFDEDSRTWRLGVWVRDSTAGVGTLTFYDPETGGYGALGHAITDSDTGLVLPVREGDLMDADIVSVRRGARGMPGELKGSFLREQLGLGSVTRNSTAGIFGRMETAPQNIFYPNGLPVGGKGDVHTGEATILSTVDGRSMVEYAVEITQVNRGNEQKSLVLHVTDERLLEKTGGIVQGMSGSPIIQDGKLVGAVTHVLVNDPTRGYGIFIENMLEAAS